MKKIVLLICIFILILNIMTSANDNVMSDFIERMGSSEGGLIGGGSSFNNNNNILILTILIIVLLFYLFIS